MIVLIVGLLLTFVSLANADTLQLVWDPAAGATSYDVERSVNFNAISGAGTWAVLQNVPSTACTGTPVQCSYTDATAPATGAFYRLVPKNATGSLPLTKKGMWYCGGCPSLPSMPAAMGLMY